MNQIATILLAVAALAPAARFAPLPELKHTVSVKQNNRVMYYEGQFDIGLRTMGVNSNAKGSSNPVRMVTFRMKPGSQSPFKVGAKLATLTVVESERNAKGQWKAMRKGVFKNVEFLRTKAIPDIEVFRISYSEITVSKVSDD